MPRFHRLLGQAIESDLALEGVPPAPSDSPDPIRILDGSSLAVPRPLPPTDEFYDFTVIGDEHVRMAWRDVGVFDCRAGREITVWAHPGASMLLIQQPLLGPVMAVILQQRGMQVLHGSAVAIDGRAALFLAESGTGKSTLASALVQTGGALLADDLCVLEKRGDEWWIQPELPRLKLTEWSVDALSTNRAETTPLPREDNKHEWRADRAFSPEPVPVGAIYPMHTGGETSIRELSASEGFMALRQHTFTIHLLELLRQNERSFEQCAALARGMAIRGLTRAADGEPPLRLAALVREDFLSLPRLGRAVAP